MYQSSSSSSSHKSPVPNVAGDDGGGLSRYDYHHQPPPLPPQHPNLVGHYFAGESSSFGLDSNNCKANSSSSNGPKDSGKTLLQRSYGAFDEIEQDSCSGASSPSTLFRRRSSPAGFFGQLSADGNGFTLGGPPTGGYGGDHCPSRPKSSQLSFGAGVHQDSLSHISEVDETAINGVVASTSNMSFGLDHHRSSWDTSSSNISFTIDQPGKRSKTTDFFTIDSQFSVSHTSMEMENLLNIPEDSVPCRVRAKRGCATHPRSIAERERRTRISGKLKKLQELVPNMDKQTSYADMLDLAVDHIKGLENQVQKLEREMEKCTCGACDKHK